MKLSWSNLNHGAKLAVGKCVQHQVSTDLQSTLANAVAKQGYGRTSPSRAAPRLAMTMRLFSQQPEPLGQASLALASKNT